MKNVFLCLALLSCAMGTVSARSDAAADVARLTAERDNCQKQLQKALTDIEDLNKRIAVRESDVVREAEMPVQRPLEAAAPVTQAM